MVNILLADVPKFLSGVAGGAQIMGRLLCGALATALMTSVLVNTMNYQYWQQINRGKIDETLITTKHARGLKRLKNLEQQLTKQHILLRESKSKKIEISNFNTFLQEIKENIIYSIRGAMGIALVFALCALLSALKLRSLHKKQE